MKLFGFLLSLALMGPSTPVAAQASSSPALSDGNQFYEQCKEGANDYQLTLCWSYVRGVTAGIQSAGTVGKKPFLCPPSSGEVTVRQLNDIVITYLRDNPKVRHLIIGPLAYEALTKAFPCAKQAK